MPYFSLSWNTYRIGIPTSYDCTELVFSSSRPIAGIVILCDSLYMIWYMVYLLTTIGLTPGGSSTVHIYTQTIHRTTQLTQTTHRTTRLTNWEECGPCPVFESYTLAFALHLRKKHGETSVRVAGECQLARWKQNIQNTLYVSPSRSLFVITDSIMK